MNHQQTTQGFPLSALFLLMGYVAVLAAMVGISVQAMDAGEITIVDALIPAAAGFFFAPLLGAALGFFHHRPGVGVVSGMVAGALLGPFLGFVFAIPRTRFDLHLQYGLAGGGLLLLLSIGIWVISKQRSASPSAHAQLPYFSGPLFQNAGPVQAAHAGSLAVFNAEIIHAEAPSVTTQIVHDGNTLPTSDMPLDSTREP